MDPTQSIDTNIDADNRSGDLLLDGSDDATELNLQWTTRTLGDFELFEQLGSGGMGEVLRAVEIGLDREVALKRLKSISSLKKSQVERFLVEARAAARLNHDHIVPIYHVGEDKGVWFYTMKLISGRNLAQIVKAAKHTMDRTEPVAGETTDDDNSEKAVPRSHRSSSIDQRDSTLDLSSATLASGLTSRNSRAATRLARNVALLGEIVADALHHAHEQAVVHRDIKPSNLMLDDDGKVWVLDFGLAQLQNAPDLTQTGDVVGTLRYMSPEQASGRRGFVDRRTDIYSLGITLYELATLRSAYRGTSWEELFREVTFNRVAPIRSINPRLPKDFETIITKATERNPDDRYQTAEQFAADLRRFINGESLEAKPPRRTKRIHDWFADRPVVAASMLGSALVFIIALSMSAWALAGMVAERNRSVESISTALRTTLGQWFIAEAMATANKDPGLSLALAKQGAELFPGSSSDEAILQILNQHHEMLHVPVRFINDGRIAIAPNGSQVAYYSHSPQADPDTTATIIDLNTGKQLTALGRPGEVSSTAYSPDSNLLVTTGGNWSPRKLEAPLESFELGSVRIWDVSQGTVLHEYDDTYALRLSCANFSPDSSRLVSRCRTIRLASFRQGDGTIARSSCAVMQPPSQRPSSHRMEIGLPLGPWTA